MISRHGRISKYGAKPETVDGIRFASKAEAKRYLQLKLLEKAKFIRDLELQPVFALEVNGQHICKYIADFRYFDVEKGETVIEDVKGYAPPLFAVKAKLMKAIHGIEVRVV